MNKSIFIAALSATMLALSCHKSSRVAPACRITGIQTSYSGTTGSYTITYNADGKPATVEFSQGGSSYTRTIVYSPGLIVATTTGAGASTDSVYLNAAGDVDHIVRRPAGSAAVTTSSFTYDGSRQIATIVVQSTNSAPITTTCKYVNGDLQETDGVLTVKYTYYPDKPSSPADLIALGQWLNYGIVYEKSAHMVQTYGSGSVIESNTYTYDNDGKIVSATSSDNSGGRSTFTFTYDCH
jgi:hypothetical protein